MAESRTTTRARVGITVAGVLVLACVAVARWTSSCSRSSAHPNVLVLLLDTTRADHLSVLGYERNTTPNIDRFARESVLFTRAYSEAPWTPPSVATLFSGLWASAHGMMPPDKTPTADTVLRKLDERVLTMAEILKSAGYATAAVSSNPWITPEFGFEQGFESFDVKLEAPADEITTAGLARVDALRANDKPFFLYLHYLDPHAPYTPPKEHDVYDGPLKNTHYIPQIQKDVNHYDGEIAYLDASLGRLFAGLKERGVYDDLAIVLLGDHGEQFGEHGNRGHGWQLFNEELHVPLVVKPGRIEHGRTVDRVASILDVLPTVLQLTHVARPAALPGVDLFDDAALGARHGVFAEIDRRYALRGYVGADGKKLVVGSAKEGEKFDPAEPLKNGVALYDTSTREIAQLDDAEKLRTMESEFGALVKRVEAAKIASGAGDGVVLNDEMLRRLRGLGYVK